MSGFEVGVIAEFHATHALRGDFGPASQPHAHAYRVEATARGARLRADGTLFDITRLQSALAAAIDRLDQRDLNTLEGLAEPNSTAEMVAYWLFGQVAPALAGQGVETLQVRVWESPEAFASYTSATGDVA